MSETQAGLITRADWTRTAEILAVALTHVRRHSGRVVLIKLGGAAMGSDAALQRFALDVSLLHQCDVRPVIVHGGGPQITGMLARLGIEARFVGGQRITDPETMQVVEMVLAGSVNKRIVAALQRQGSRAVGLSGRDSNLLRVRRARTADGADLGQVGTPEAVDTTILEELLAAGVVPVIAPVAFDAAGDTYNVNADTAAGAIAAALKAARLLLLTDVEGVVGADGQLLASLTADAAGRLIEDGTIARGMIPKVRTACDAVQAGVRAAVILDGRAPHATLLELFTDRGAGTMVSMAPR